MKNGNISILSLVLLLAHNLILAQAAEEDMVPAGMELRMVGQTSIVVPKDAEIQEKGGLIIVEQIDKYVARTLLEMRQQIKAVKEQQEMLSKEVEQLKAELADKNNIKQ